ncbi:MAG TPA: hypothetical protein VIS74_03905 [Chthoniobacterales bacterium]
MILVAAPGLWAETVGIADFETDSGFDSGLVVDDTVAKEGQKSGRMDVDFEATPPVRWKTAAKSFDIQNEIQALSFWIKTSTVRRLAVRIVDSTGQTFQSRPVISPFDEWQQVEITSFTSGPGFQSFGGAADGVVHWPAKSLALILEKGGIADGGTVGTLWIDQVELTVEGEPRSTAAAGLEAKTAGAEREVLADFEQGTMGFTGTIAEDSAQAKSGNSSARIDADFSKPTVSWVSTGKKLAIPDAIKLLRFWVKSEGIGSLAVRLTDSTGQSHMLRPMIKPGADWQEVVIADFTKGRGHQSYGGAGDGQVHWPVTSLAFVVEKNPAAPVQATVWLDDIEIFHGPE